MNTQKPTPSQQPGRDTSKEREERKYARPSEDSVSKDRQNGKSGSGCGC